MLQEEPLCENITRAIPYIDLESRFMLGEVGAFRVPTRPQYQGKIRKK